MPKGLRLTGIQVTGEEQNGEPLTYRLGKAGAKNHRAMLIADADGRRRNLDWGSKFHVG